MSRAPNLEARERIVKAAYALMYARGFQDVSMDDVAAAAGLKKANLFHYYPTKEALGLAVFDHASAQMRAKMAESLAKEEDPIRLVEGMFSEGADGMAASRCRGGCFVGNLAQELSDHYERMRLKVSAHIKEWTGQLAAALERARARGQFRKEMKCRESAEAILSLFEGATLLAKANKETEPMENAKGMAVAYLKAYKKG